MKKLLAILLALVMVLSLAACAGEEAPVEETPVEETYGEEVSLEEEPVEEEPNEELSAEDVALMTYADYVAAELDTPVTVECYVQNHQSWWDNKITVYAADADGAYFLYEMACSEEDAAKLVPGTKIRVSGYKGEWAGEVEIMDATFTFVEGADTYIAEPVDATALLGTDELLSYQNQFASFKGMTVEASNDEGAAFLYNWDGSGAEGSDSDLYFKASVNGQTYTFVIEYYLTGADTDVYKAVQALEVGQTIDMEGFLYWYEGVQPHITAITVAE